MSRNNQRKRQQMEWDLGRLPSRGEMINILERLHKARLAQVSELERSVVGMQEMCASKGWAADYVHKLEMRTEKLQLAMQYAKAVEMQLSELYSGTTKGWPLRKEVSFGECYPNYSDELRGGHGSAHMGAL